MRFGIYVCLDGDVSVCACVHNILFVCVFGLYMRPFLCVCVASTCVRACVRVLSLYKSLFLEQYGECLVKVSQVWCLQRSYVDTIFQGTKYSEEVVALFLSCESTIFSF